MKSKRPFKKIDSSKVAKLSEYGKRIRTYGERLTIDQKKFRVLSYLMNKNEGSSLKPILDRIGTTQKNTEPDFFEDMEKNDKWIYTTHEKATVKYKISEEGKLLINTLRFLKKSDPENAILKFDVFNMTQNEENDNDPPHVKKQNFEDHFKIESLEDPTIINEIKNKLKLD